MHKYEIEVKSLLGSKQKADEFRKKLLKSYPGTKLVGNNKQLNHYFNAPESLSVLIKPIVPILPKDRVAAFKKIVAEGKNVSIRSREAEGKIFFVIKASVGGGTSANAVSRIEFESEVNCKTLAELDTILLKAGLSYQAKWSREREEYAGKNFHVTIDKNAGYGYLAEFEKIIDDEGRIAEARKELEGLMNNLGVFELAQDRLERMFKHYNTHWAEYYGTDKTFIVE